MQPDPHVAYRNETIVAVATPAGRGGIGIVRLSGPEAVRIAEPMLRLRNPMAQAEHGLGNPYCFRTREAHNADAPSAGRGCYGNDGFISISDMGIGLHVLQRLRKNSRLVSGHDFTDCGKKTPGLYQGPLVVP